MLEKPGPKTNHQEHDEEYCLRHDVEEAQTTVYLQKGPKADNDELDEEQEQPPRTDKRWAVHAKSLALISTNATSSETTKKPSTCNPRTA